MRAYDLITRVVAGVLGIVSPHRAAAYRYGRQLLRTYAAGLPGGPNAAWLPRRRSADAEIRLAHKRLLPRARDLAQNSPYIAGGIERILNNVVRSGIRPQARIQTASGRPNTAANRRLERLWAQWVPHADLSGQLSYYGLQRLVLRHDWIDGEVLVHRVWDDSIPGVVPLRLEVLESEHLDDTVDGELPNGRLARRGIELDPATGRPVAYHVLPYHPGDYLAYGRRPKARRIPAADIIHLYERRRASQTRGVSRLAPIIMEAYDLSEYKAAERIGARLAAAFGVFVKSSLPELGPGIGTAAETDTTLPDYIEPGRIQALPFGTEIQVASHNRPGGQYESYVRDSVRSLSVATGISYEAFSNDYTSASYSSARSASLEERISYQALQQYLNERFNSRVWTWFVEAAMIAGLAPYLPGYGSDPRAYHEAVAWQCPGWTWVDPLKDSRAAATGIELVTTTRSKIAAQQGEDWDETLEQAIAEERRLADLYRLRRENRQLQEVADAS
ncbi:phage portal protein [Dissulfurirhabdus thermomarina]|uniref:Phage portal protein n=1 Tax=Dissulfurirhabdus thermomarina TaxID=1765737 RepID=A0A6N9TLF9_DISTH|nr:phage portal protein [Dissulfurirhabdus thermomarina]NDY41260.1 phage portal protein [Dissulfurirhabdus thermomarina]